MRLQPELPPQGGHSSKKSIHADFHNEERLLADDAVVRKAENDIYESIDDFTEGVLRDPEKVSDILRKLDVMRAISNDPKAGELRTALSDALIQCVDESLRERVPERDDIPVFHKMLDAALAINENPRAEEVRREMNERYS